MGTIIPFQEMNVSDLLGFYEPINNQYKQDKGKKAEISWKIKKEAKVIASFPAQITIQEAQNGDFGFVLILEAFGIQATLDKNTAAIEFYKIINENYSKIPTQEQSGAGFGP